MPSAGTRGSSEELWVSGTPLGARHRCARPPSRCFHSSHPAAHCTVTRWLEARAWAEVAGCEHGQMNQRRQGGWRRRRALGRPGVRGELMDGMTRTGTTGGRATRVGAKGLPMWGWSLTFYWCFKGPGHCHHYIGAKHLEGEERSLEGGGAGRDRRADLRRLDVLLRYAGRRQGAGRGSGADMKLSRWRLKLVLGTLHGTPGFGQFKGIGKGPLTYLARLPVCPGLCSSKRCPCSLTRLREEAA